MLGEKRQGDFLGKVLPKQDLQEPGLPGRRAERGDGVSEVMETRQNMVQSGARKLSPVTGLLGGCGGAGARPERAVRTTPSFLPGQLRSLKRWNPGLARWLRPALLSDRDTLKVKDKGTAHTHQGARG